MSESSAKAVAVEEEVPNARRDFLKMGLAAAAAATAAGIVSKPEAANAVNGDVMNVAGSEAGTSTTLLDGSQFRVVDGNNGISLYGHRSGSDGIGVLGQVGPTAAGLGVVGRGYGTGNIGVLGEHFGSSTAAGSGVKGTSNGDSSIGVEGRATGAAGVGVLGGSTAGAALQLVETSATVPPTTGTWSAGQFLVKSGQLWYCVTGGSGTASKWVRLSSPFVPLGIPKRAASQGTFHNAGQTKTKGLGSAVPAGAKAVVFNIMLLDTKGKGQLSIVGANRSFSGTFANISWWGKDQRLSNTTVSNVSSDRKVKIRASGSGGAKYAIDVIGYYV